MNTNPYWYVKAWGLMMSQSLARTACQVQLARQDEAPQSVIYKGLDGWVLLEHVTSPERRAILTNMVLTMKEKGW